MEREKEDSRGKKRSIVRSEILTEHATVMLTANPRFRLWSDSRPHEGLRSVSMVSK